MKTENPTELFPGLPARTIPDSPLKPRRKQNEAPLPLEMPEIEAKEPPLIKDGSGYVVQFTLKTFTVRDPHEPDGAILHKEGFPLRDSESVARYARNSVYEMNDADKEHFVLLALNNKNRVIGFKVISTGSLTASLVHPREVYRAALYFDAAAVIFLHNHPSGDPAPSPEDIEITKRLKECGDLFGIRVLDHIVLGHDRHWSFSDKGML